MCDLGVRFSAIFYSVAWKRAGIRFSNVVRFRGEGELKECKNAENAVQYRTCKWVLNAGVVIKVSGLNENASDEKFWSVNVA